MWMNIGENQHYAHSDESSTFLIESYESSADFQPMDRFANESNRTQCEPLFYLNKEFILLQLGHTISCNAYKGHIDIPRI